MFIFKVYKKNSNLGYSYSVMVQLSLKSLVILKKYPPMKSLTFSKHPNGYKCFSD